MADSRSGAVIVQNTPAIAVVLERKEATKEYYCHAKYRDLGLRSEFE